MERIPRENQNNPDFNASPEQSGELKDLAETEALIGELDSQSKRIIDEAQTFSKELEKSKLPEKQKSLFKLRFKRVLNAAFEIFAFTSLVLNGIKIGRVVNEGVENYHASRYKVEEKIMENGRVEYQHEDPETTRMIEILSGKADFTFEEKMELLKNMLERENDNERIGDIDLTQLARERIGLENLTEQEILDEFVADPHPGEFDPQLYDALWQLEKECGSPKIRMLPPDSEKPRSFYEAHSNTMFLEAREIRNMEYLFLSEASHAKQYDESPLSSRLKFLRDMLMILSKYPLQKGIGLITGENPSILDVRDQHSYSTPGTQEHDAHSVIEPQLKSKLDAMTPNRAELRKAAREAKYLELLNLDEQEEREISELRKWFDETSDKHPELYEKLLVEYSQKYKETQDKFSRQRLAVERKYHG